jgi:eukaryotic-like serine/threonine-protein kinase
VQNNPTQHLSDIIPAAMLQIGDQFDHFQIQEHVARGGMADIYRAYDVVNRRQVALKIPDKALIGDPAQYERFQREMEVSRTLDHPAVQHGLGYGQFNRIPYLASEFVEGRMLRDLITESAPLPPEQAISLIRQIAEGMAYCHDNQVVHRDLKPENILVTTDGKPVIMDFGLALTKGSHRVTYGSLSGMAGSPDYMSPEQVEGQRGDPRTDIYALGTILFEMLSGQLPFSGDSNLAVMSARVNHPAPRLDSLQPTISPQIAAIAARSLQRDPTDRYQTMGEFIDALDHPEAADLALLDQAVATAAAGDPLRALTFKAIGLSILILLGIIALALTLQALRP